MNAPTQNISTLSDTLKARKSHLAALLNIIDVRTGASSKTQTLTINAIKAEMRLIEHKLRNRS
ncbi:hypothetical protein [Pseudomonas brassicacearum]|jgi:hypothetical protein|uniref:hypothetical protein n=1 Tax=Pseudomonas brassicacearum TaxID=930166 RepID=UPI0005B51A92|nr:hypothetical protein [Pseudomonas brassicacearum]